MRCGRVGAACEKHRHHFAVTKLGGGEERGHSGGIDGLDVCLQTQERLRVIDTAQIRCLVQRRVVAGVGCVDEVGCSTHKSLDGIRFIVVPGGQMQRYSPPTLVTQRWVTSLTEQQLDDGAVARVCRPVQRTGACPVVTRQQLPVDFRCWDSCEQLLHSLRIAVRTRFR